MRFSPQKGITKDERFLRYASEAFEETRKIFVIGDEMRGRVLKVFAGVPELESKLSDLHLGVDTSEFEPLERRFREAAVEAGADGLWIHPSVDFRYLSGLELLSIERAHGRERRHDVAPCRGDAQGPG